MKHAKTMHRKYYEQKIQNVFDVENGIGFTRETDFKNIFKKACLTGEINSKFNVNSRPPTY